MRILVIHDYYQQPGGEDRVFEAEADLLERYGNEVYRLTFDNNQIRTGGSVRESVVLAASTVWSIPAYRRIQEAVRSFRPEVVHFHNPFPLVSPSGYYACRDEGAAVIQTLHNYRSVCANGVMLRDGHVCDDCIGKAIPWPAVRHACYRSSRSLSGVVAASQISGRLVTRRMHAVDRYVALSNWSRDIFVRGGLSPESVVIKPNFVPKDPGVGAHDGGYALYAGRLSPEKGVETLLDAWSRVDSGLSLKIAGDGVLAPSVSRAASENRKIEWVGRQTPDQLMALMGGAAFLVFPSEWHETFGLTIIEAYSRGTPVVASRMGAPAELVPHNESGLLFQAGDPDSLAAAVGHLTDNPHELQRMGANARRLYESHYTAERNYQMLSTIYQETIDRTNAT